MLQKLFVNEILLLIKYDFFKKWIFLTTNFFNINSLKSISRGHRLPGFLIGKLPEAGLGHVRIIGFGRRLERLRIFENTRVTGFSALCKNCFYFVILE
jgi:hypothetical protein